MRMRRIAALVVVAACSSHHDGATIDAARAIDAPAVPPDAPSYPATLDGNRDRLLASFLAYLESTPATTQSNGLSGATITTVCELWSALHPSDRDVFLTITHRLEGAGLTDGSHALDHI